MSAKEPKMNWLVNQYTNGEISYEVHDTNEKYGTVCVPTGGGKSGMMIRDMIWHIDHIKSNETLVINMSAPMLNLCGQLADDLFSVIKDTHQSRCADKEFAIFINSSKEDKYYKMASANAVGQIYEFEKFDETMNNNPGIRVAFVISCHASLHKFALKIKDLDKKKYTFINYLDEAHVLVNFTQRRDFIDFEDKQDSMKLNKEERVRVSAMDLLLKHSHYLYCFSATPDKYVTRFINKRKQTDPNKQLGNYHIYNVSPIKLIEQGIIVKPDIYLAKIQNEMKINAEIAMEFMEFCKANNPNIHHKVLICCDNSNHIEELEQELNLKKCAVFSTCAKKGAHSNYNGEDEDEEGNFVDISSSDFIKEVDEYDGDCYVLHIKQLRAGIDIKTLTDCIIRNTAARVNDGVKVKYVQTIGRILRPYSGERGRTDDGRLKKNGNVLFLIGMSDFDIIGHETTRFAIKYYGLDGVKAFTKDVDAAKTGVGQSHEINEAARSWENETKFEIQEARENIFKFIKENVFIMAETIKMGNYIL